MRKHIFIPDIQVKPGSPNDHLRWIGEYIVEQKPDVIVQIGDFADMPSLSSYDKGKVKGEGVRVKDDIDACMDAWDELNEPIERFNRRKRKNKERQYKPEKHITLGNHEHRIDRHVDANPELLGLLSTDNLQLDRYGWEVHPFLDVVEIDGVHYSHYFANQFTGKPLGGMLSTRIKNVGFSFTMGHQQLLDSTHRYLANGTRQRGLVCGSCYLYDDDYRGIQANGAWHGIIVMHEVHNGDYDLMEVSLDFLCRRYEGMTLKQFMLEKYDTVLARHRNVPL